MLGKKRYYHSNLQLPKNPSLFVRLIAGPWRNLETEGKWHGLLRHDKKAWNIWKGNFLDMKDGFRGTFAHNANEVMFCISFAAVIAFAPHMIYAYTMMKSQFQKKYQFYTDSILSRRKSPLQPDPWDVVKKKEDGHYYIGNERVDV